MRQQLNIVTLGVEDLQRSLKFYKDGLGWKLSSASNENIAFFQMGGVVFSLYLRDKLAEDIKIKSDGDGFSGITLAYNAKDEAEVDKVLQQVESLGAKIIKKAEKVFWGGYSGYFADFDGHLWEVAWNPFFEFDESDNLVLP
ncbi:glyoxalase/bleomycin resistance protein/dioxygenase [Calothrix parasitica NIES-267]|uniref:Glyoxalase/bleomycin resistance protein/dioxygenase n=1 Tax=Calothrix parasitica NIES-267 TaxID=1973488 RepID=A0A1Z4LIP5_9CYAN|nr:glyoxalase/bleomycin resistance protein/dioxygenase [Calothrix parasitica NIES-267]